MGLKIIRDDISRMSTRVDAIVNSANPLAKVGGGADAAIHEAAGPELLKAREEIGPIARGDSAMTPAYNLNARWVIHTVAPVWEGGDNGEVKTLANCYRKCLHLAATNRCKSIAFPLLATGVYGFPKDQALNAAIDEIHKFLLADELDMTVYLVVYDRTSFVISQKLDDAITSYINDSAVREQSLEQRRRRLRLEECKTRQTTAAIDEYLEKKGSGSFRKLLIELRDRRDMTNAQLYKLASIDRRVFSHFMNSTKSELMPSRDNCIALGLALRLDLPEFRDFLARSGYALSSSDHRDLIIEYCIETGGYNIDRINAFLFDRHLPLFGSTVK